MKSELIPFWKFHGTGNDFVVLDNRFSKINLSEAQIEDLCRFHTGIGADGLIMLEEKEGNYHMRYHNSDGRLSSFCGNGSRCFLAFARLMGLVKVAEGLDFFAADGKHTSRLIHEEGNHWLVETKMEIGEPPQQRAQGIIAQTGSPHLLIEVDERDLASTEFEKIAAEIRYSDAFREKGINVNWFFNDAGLIRLRTYERGVERETLSCGTAAVAAAVWWKKRYGAPNSKRVNVQTKGGILTILWDKEGQVWLRGPVYFTFQGTWQGFAFRQ